ncbi:MAG: MbnH family di-heme enzyme [Chitinophagaceae bacterium]
MQTVLLKLGCVASFILGLNALFQSPKKKLSSNKKELVILGKFLFFDTRLSYNNIRSCASCHDPKFAFSDGYRTSLGADGFSVQRNAPSLINAVYRSSYTWGDSTIRTFSQQMQFPLFNEHPKEMGVKNNEAIIIERFKKNNAYQQLFKKAFIYEEEPIHITNIIKAIAAFEATLVSNNAPFNKFINGDTNALSIQAKRGMKLFFSEKLQCGSCHSGKYLDGNSTNNFYNTGLYNVNNNNVYPEADKGLYHITKAAKDDGKFKVPSLQNILLTAPYTHDGTVNSVEEMIDIYASGGRNITEGKWKGNGILNDKKSNKIKGFTISQQEKKELILFLASLTDSSILKNKYFKNPFHP